MTAPPYPSSSELFQKIIRFCSLELFTYSCATCHPPTLSVFTQPNVGPSVTTVALNRYNTMNVNSCNQHNNSHNLAMYVALFLGNPKIRLQFFWIGKFFGESWLPLHTSEFLCLKWLRTPVGLNLMSNSGKLTTSNSKDGAEPEEEDEIVRSDCNKPSSINHRDL